MLDGCCSRGVWPLWPRPIDGRSHLAAGDELAAVVAEGHGLAVQVIESAKHIIIPDEPTQIEQQLIQLCDRPDLNALVFNGGTGIAPRDTTYDALSGLLEKTLPGFGEIFRYLSYQEIGSRAIASRAIAGVYHRKLVFSLPGSSGAVKLALEKLILPELIHLVQLLT
ncbi:MAG: molybdenum cofactor biosynthesis protein MoaB [Hydrococcus sp. RU_2_2]|nr:molybdenum cofactor biosynthesis protein MoaB [Hydrococcus sp. RU_2_2]